MGSGSKTVARQGPRQSRLIPQTAEDLRPSPGEVSPAIALQRVLSVPDKTLRSRDIAVLQRSLGNNAVQRLLTRGAVRRPPAVTGATIAPSPTGSSLLVIQRQFWEYTGDHPDPQRDPQAEKFLAWRPDPPDDGFEQIKDWVRDGPPDTPGKHPVYRKRASTPPSSAPSSTPATTKAEGTRGTALAEPRESPGGQKPKRPAHLTHRRMQSSVNLLKEIEESDAHTAQYPFATVHKAAVTHTLYKLAGEPLLVFEPSAGLGKTEPAGQGFRCAIGERAFDEGHGGVKITDPKERLDHAVLCMLHELDHARHRTMKGAEGTTPGYFEQEFAVRSADMERGQQIRGGLPVPAGWGLAERAMIGYVQLMIARADREYAKVGETETALDPTAQEAKALALLPAEVKSPGPQQEQFRLKGAQFLAEIGGPVAALQKEAAVILLVGYLTREPTQEKLLRGYIETALKKIAEIKEARAKGKVAVVTDE